MDRGAAEEIIPILINADEITRAMRIYQRCTPAGQTKPFTDAIGRMLNEFHRLILPMVRVYPDPDPGGFPPDRRDK